MEKENKSMIGIMTQSDTDEVKGENKVLTGVNANELKTSTQSTIGYLGDALNDDNINDVIGEIRPHLVILVGFPKYGKSTFVSSLYHVLLTEGKIGENKFVDSDTILGFERRIFVRRYEKNFKKRLNRTALLENYFLTLDFIDKNKEQKKLIISDRSGEAYERYCSNAVEMREDRALKYANHIVFFLDASTFLVSNNLMEHTLIRQLINRFNSEGILKPNMTIDIIFNKIDTVEESKKGERYEKNKEAIINTIETDGNIKINRVFEINSNITEGNIDLHNLFAYFVNSCNSFCIDENEEETNQLDWTKNKLN
jgi:GTPase involved in cell partitioning and DNA repair